VVDILEEAPENIQKLVGVSGGDESAFSPWLISIMALYFGASSAIAKRLQRRIAPFQETICTPPQERWVALVAGVVMATNSVVAVTLGILLPMEMKCLKLDPTIVSKPLLTTMP